MITIDHKGFLRTKNFFKNLKKYEIYDILEYYGQKGVEELQKRTPVYTGLLQSSWYFKIDRDGDDYWLIWCNDDIEQDGNVALLIQYGFVTSSGYKVQGRDYINPALKGIYREIKRTVESEVKRIGTD